MGIRTAAVCVGVCALVVTGGCKSCTPGPPEGMIRVPGATFQMGCNEATDGDCVKTPPTPDELVAYYALGELPYHAVTVPTFDIDRTEVTRVAYGACVGAGACADVDPGTPYADPATAQRPVTMGGWEVAAAYCAWRTKRLCTEAEWELAARGTDGRRHPWGNDPPTCARAAVTDDAGGECKQDAPGDVGQHPAGASPYGVLDMAGNVAEWVEDDLHGDYTGAPADGTAWVDSPRHGFRVTRGGPNDPFSADLGASRRCAWAGNVSHTVIGIRCCHTP